MYLKLCVVSFLSMGMFAILPLKVVAHTGENLATTGAETLFSGGVDMTAKVLYYTKTKMYDGTDTIDNLNDEKETELQILNSFGYGLTENITLSFVVPYRFTTRENINEEQDLSGIGDISVLSKYRFFKTPTISTSGIFGVQLPTGLNANLDEFEHPIELGSGTADLLMGGSLTFERDRFAVRSLVFGQFNGTKDGDKHSDTITASVETSTNFPFGGYDDGQVTATIGAAFEHRFDELHDDSVNDDSGGDILWLTGRLNYLPSVKPFSTLNLFFEVQYPYYQNLKGQQLGQSMQFAVGVNLLY